MTVFEQKIAAALEPTIREAMRIAWDPDDVTYSLAPRVAAAIAAAANHTAGGILPPSMLEGIEQAALEALLSRE